MNVEIIEKIKHDFGSEILKAFSEKSIYEIDINADGKIWFCDRVKGVYFSHEMNSTLLRSLIYSIASLNSMVINEEKPYLECSLPVDNPFDQARIEAIIPPVTTAPVMAIRKRPIEVYPIEDYVKTKRLDRQSADYILNAVKERKNLVITGGPNTGKTTFINALLDSVSKFKGSEERILTLEDTPELKCSCCNRLSLYTTTNIDLNKLVQFTLRLNPTRVIVGEVRNKAMFDLLKSWNTGTSGGFCSVHANNVNAALQRIIDLAMEAGVNEPISLIEHTIDVIVSFIRVNDERKWAISEIAEVCSYDKTKDQFKLTYIKNNH